MKRTWRIKAAAIVSISLIVTGGITACNKKEDNNNNKEPQGVTVTAEPTEKGADPTKKEKPTQKPAEPTEEAAPSPEVTVEPSPAAGNETFVNQEDAEKIIRGIVNDNSYKIKLKDEKIDINGKNYYIFTISRDGKTEDAAIAVDRGDASVYYYNNGIISEFTRFPLDNVEVVDNDEKNIEEQEAVQLVSSLSKEQLGLDKPFSEYETDTDPWTTVVKGKECYCVNVFDTEGARRQLTGVFYAAADGSVIYRLDEDNNFIKISE